ncbi:MAG: hypothetical protein CVT60_05870 [Actinobacteria bacterium HGW-Actinobacteria-10]|jgi:sugar O-acyltransferase (sialic acid O-acetyltransferase NeuD family)|nr:MAG: hypothetical protein CVT60_05870 [Actinobacteria bacterium HGW-Actinobacteria-10]
MRFLVIGAGGFSLEIADLVTLLGHEVAGFFDEAGSADRHPTIPVTVFDTLPDDGFDAAVIAIGDSAARRRVYAMVADRYELPVLTHPSASVSPFARLGAGTLVMQNVTVSAQAVVGENTLINVGCYVAHDCRVGAHSHLAAAVNMGGGSSVGEGALCGTGSILLPGIQVGAWATLGAGAVATRDIPAEETWVGIPALPIHADAAAPLVPECES